MTTIVVGATGATGQLLVRQLLDRGQKVKAVMRSSARMPESVKDHPNLTLIEAGILDLSAEDLAGHVEGVTSIASCLGHNLTFKGMFGSPRRLVKEAVRCLCDAVLATHSEEAVRFVLMNTTGNRNRDLEEPISFAQKCVIGLLRVCLPPHADNEEAADFLRTEIGRNDSDIEWAVVRPDNLIDEESVTDYELHPSPTRSAIFDAGKTSRINVSHLMADLITDPNLWQQWKGQMPVIYNKEDSVEK